MHRSLLEVMLKNLRKQMLKEDPLCSSVVGPVALALVNNYPATLRQGTLNSGPHKKGRCKSKRDLLRRKEVDDRGLIRR